MNKLMSTDNQKTVESEKPAIFNLGAPCPQRSSSVRAREEQLKDNIAQIKGVLRLANKEVAELKNTVQSLRFEIYKRDQTINEVQRA